jgi:hypothetical protein
MRRLLTAAVAATMLLLPAAAQGGSGLKLRGTVIDENGTSGLVTVASKRLQHVLDVPGSLSAIRVGQRVELRNTTLRMRGEGARVLARGVAIVSAHVASHADRNQDERDDDERELRGRITALSPLTVAGLICVVPNGVALTGFRVGDVVEVTCDLIRGTWTLRKIHLEDDHEVRGDDDDEDRSDRGDDERDGDNNDRLDGADHDRDDGDDADGGNRGPGGGDSGPGRD